MLMQTDRPTDLEPLTEIVARLRIPYATLRAWQRDGKIGEYKVEGVYMASVEQVTRYAQRPRRKLPKDE